MMMSLAKFRGVRAIVEKGTIAMWKHNGHGATESDKVGRAIARQSRIAARVARQFDDTDTALAREVRDILEHMPEQPVRTRKVGA